jgi:hypothetical protein
LLAIETDAGSQVIVKECAIYNAGDNGVQLGGGPALFIDCNIGVELPNDDEDLDGGALSGTVFRNCRFGEHNGLSVSGHYRLFGGTRRERFERYQRTLNDDRIPIYVAGDDWIRRIAVVEGSGDPEKRSGGADYVIHVDACTAPVYEGGSADSQKPQRSAVEHVIYPTDTSEITIRCYVQCADACSAQQVWMKATYIEQYYSDTVWREAEALSDETISARSGADDWSQYVEVTITPAVANQPVYVELFAQQHDTGVPVYLDPALVVS